MTQPRRQLAKFVTLVTIAVAAIGIAPTIAEAQARGSLQVSAHVVSTDNAFRVLEAARAAVSGAVSPNAGRRTETAPTVARVTVARDPRSLVVTIDYSRN